MLQISLNSQLTYKKFKHTHKQTDTHASHGTESRISLIFNSDFLRFILSAFCTVFARILGCFRIKTDLDSFFLCGADSIEGFERSKIITFLMFRSFCLWKRNKKNTRGRFSGFRMILSMATAFCFGLNFQKQEWEKGCFWEWFVSFVKRCEKQNLKNHLFTYQKQTFDQQKSRNRNQESRSYWIKTCDIIV